jgi:hypothetical protein
VLSAPGILINTPDGCVLLSASEATFFFLNVNSAAFALGADADVFVVCVAVHFSRENK